MTDYDRYGTIGRREDDRRREWERGDDSIFAFGGRREDRQDPDRSRRMERSRGGWDRERSEYRDRGQDWRERGGPGWEQERERQDRDRGVTYYGSDDYHNRLPIDETSHLIASNKVEGTSVYGRDGERLGSVYNFMVDKFSGRVEYAVMVYGGFMGLGERYFPLPWQVLDYDVRRGGYRIDMSERDLRDAPSFDRDNEPHFDREYGSRVHNYYGLRY